MGDYFVYMLTNKWHTVLYTGFTDSIEGRLAQHKHKLFPGFTKKYNCDQLVYFEKFDCVDAAIAREKQIKGRSRVKKNALIATMNSEWSDLSAIWQSLTQGILRSAQD